MKNQKIKQKNTEWLHIHGVHMCGLILFCLSITLLIDSFSPISIPEFSALGMLHRPLIIIYNMLLFLSMGGILLLFKKREVLFSTFSMLWVGLSLANNFLVELRGTPLTKYDFYTATNGGLKVAGDFLSSTHYIKIVSFILIFIALVYLAIKLSKNDFSFNKKKYMFSYAVVLLITLSLNIIIFGNNKSLSYSQKGFVHALSSNIFATTMTKPENYNKRTLEALKGKLDKTYSTKKEEDYPNIIAIQLESFFDLKTVKGLKLSENPTPFWDELSKKYTSGVVDVPTIGGGTARSEFEFITSGSMSEMPDGLIPHDTFLRKDNFFSNAHSLKEQGYTSHLIHNYMGSFYNRVDAFRNLGFDTFTSAELITYSTTDPGSVKASNDGIFPVHLKTILRSTPGKDFIFGITAELHGPYDNSYYNPSTSISVENSLPKEVESQINEYANRLKDMDNTISDIISGVESEGEPTIIIFYGDHLPPLNFKGTNFEYNHNYETPYVIWDNIGLEQEDENLPLYQLFSKAISSVGIEGSYLNNLQSSLKNDDSYTLYEDLVQYDVMFGKNYIGENIPVESNPMKIGHSNIQIDKVYKEDNFYIFEGENFTNHTYLVVDNEKYNIICMNDRKLKIEDSIDLENKNVYLEIMIGDDKQNIAQSNAIKIKTK